jgi:prepilin-type processing-associated H-X9-DG protein
MCLLAGTAFWGAFAMQEYRHASRGFTFSELLLVTAALLILATVLFPVFARAREQVRFPTCTANFRQYSHAFLLYIQDYDGTFPCWMTSEPYRRGELPFTTWDLLLQSYLQDFGAGRCPNDPFPAFIEFRDGASAWRSYAAPRNLMWPRDRNNPRDPLYPMKLARVTQPAGTVMLIEKSQGAEVNGWPYPGTRRPRCWPCGSAFENYQQCAWERHGERVNALFVDGRVKTLHGQRQGSFRHPADLADKSFRWPHLDGYVFRPGVGTLLDPNANGDQYWEYCPIPGEEPNSKCLNADAGSPTPAGGRTDQIR